MDLFDYFYDYLSQNKHHLSNNIFHKNIPIYIIMKSNAILINYYPEISEQIKVNQ